MEHTHHCRNVSKCRGAREAEALPEELSPVEARSDLHNKMGLAQAIEIMKQTPNYQVEKIERLK